MPVSTSSPTARAAWGCAASSRPSQRRADFAIDKPSRTPCPHLAADAGCSIHAELPARGFPGCTVYDCFGAGQHVVQVQFGGADTLA